MTKKKFLLTGTALILIAVSVFFFHRERSADKRANAGIELQCFKLTNGWGYAIYINHHKFIEQSFVPAIKERICFPTRRSAEETGNLVIRKLMEGKSPALSLHDLAVNGILQETGVSQ